MTLIKSAVVNQVVIQFWCHEDHGSMYEIEATDPQGAKRCWYEGFEKLDARVGYANAVMHYADAN